MANELSPPWREITTDDYYLQSQRRFPGTQARVAAYDRMHDLLSRQHADEIRLRLVLREAHDLKPGIGRNPMSVEDYEYGPSMALGATQVILVLKNGQRHRLIG